MNLNEMLADSRAQAINAGGNFVALGRYEGWISRHKLVSLAVENGDPEEEAWARTTVKRQGWAETGHGYDRIDEFAGNNIVPTGGLNYLLNVGMPVAGGYSQKTSWYVGLFKNNTTPNAAWASNWAGAGSGPLGTELADAEYDESGRQLAVFAAASGGVKAFSAATVFTLASGTSGISLYGATLNSVATVGYNATDQILLAASLFQTPKTGLGATDKANVTYTLTATSS